MRTKSEIATAFAARSELDGKTSFFLVGIGGAGMSGVARMLHHRGFRVKGTDSTDSPLIRQMIMMGMDIRIGHSGENIEPDDAVVLSDAIDLNTSPEVAAARKQDCVIVRRSQALGWLLRGKRVIAVTGTHGKTTTTGMVAMGLRAAGLDPTVVVGAEVEQLGGSVIEGNDPWAVIEACEAYDSFHDFDPEIAILTNVELDHVDFHENWENLRDSVSRFASRVPPTGALVYHDSDPGSVEIADDVSVPKLAVADSAATNLDLNLPGQHNRQNAALALAAIERAGFNREEALKGIAAFSGAERRLQVIAESIGGVTIIDDYAHHPTEIRATIESLRQKYPGRRLVVVYQPHLYSRTAPLIPEFAEALSLADFVAITDIYPAREKPLAGVSSFRIAEAIAVPCRYIPSRHLLPRELVKIAEKGDVVIGMGAGNIADFAPDFRREMERVVAGRIKVTVLFAGDSAEREVSIHSGLAVSQALRNRGYETTTLDVTDRLLTGRDVAELSGLERPDVVFLALHGSRAEDGAIQGFLELLHLTYTGSGLLASALAMDKNRTKSVLEEAGLPVPRGVRVAQGEVIPEFPCPAVVKPNAQGSTVGLSFVSEPKDLAAAVRKGLEYDTAVLIEERVSGIEISIPVMGDRALPVVEIVPQAGDYDFANKYTPGATDEICPARISAEQTELAQSFAVRAHQALGCRGVSRTDMIVTDDRIVVLEVNTLPGMTATSLVPRSASVAGIDFENLVEWMVQDALKTPTE